MVRKGPARVALRRAQGDTRLRHDFGILRMGKIPAQMHTLRLPRRCQAACPGWLLAMTKFLKADKNSVGLWVSSQQPRVKIKQNRAGQCDKGIKDLSIAG